MSLPSTMEQKNSMKLHLNLLLQEPTKSEYEDCYWDLAFSIKIINKSALTAHLAKNKDKIWCTSTVCHLLVVLKLWWHALMNLVIWKLILWVHNKIVVSTVKSQVLTRATNPKINFLPKGPSTHTVQKLIVIFNKLPRTFGSCLSLSDI